MKVGQKGFSLVETMIVLAIVGLVFVAFFKLFSVLSNRESLKKGTDVVVVDINDILNDISVGSFDDQEGVHCHRAGQTSQRVVFDKDADALPGHHDECIFLGKSVQLGAGPGTVGVPTTGADQSNKYTVYTLIGLSANTTAGQTTDIDNYNFFVFRHKAANSNEPNFDSTVYGFTRSIEITHSYIWNDSATTGTQGSVDWSSEVIYIDGFAVFLTTFGAVRSSHQRAILGGARNIGLYGAYLDNSSKTDASRVRPTLPDYATQTEGSRFGGSTQYYHPVEGEVIICFQGSGGRSYVRVGSFSGALAAESELDAELVNDRCT